MSSYFVALALVVLAVAAFANPRKDLRKTLEVAGFFNLEAAE